MSELSAQERIKIAATKVFTLKGLEGARMQDIADEANINKAMLHYYFRNKKQLFEIIFEEKLHKIFGAMELLIFSKDAFENRIRAFVEKQISIVLEFPVMPIFVMLEVRKNPELLEGKFKNIPLDVIRDNFRKVIDGEVMSGNIRRISLEELLLNVMSLCIYPIIAEPILKYVLDLNQESYFELIEARKKSVSDLIINDLKILK
ncbi:MAG: TetR/AcrR family transcriptional regulator [Saprospiraceae bacterium]|nr:TetR/AcrR family transcriptional regulator [Saprospiraceae bacterium]MBP6569359.1 TetR/AcrR family transcriptional regulator [Saprospiraceae bacterium]